MWCQWYLENLKKYREEGKHLYEIYLDETCVKAGEFTNKTWVDKTVESCRDVFVRGLTTGSKNPTGKGKRLIVEIMILHIVGRRVCTRRTLMFRIERNTNDYHNGMNGDTFFE